jgi:flagellar motility protein MotE (MotC chaperone)
MPRPLKVFRVHLGFYDTIVAAPSQKAAIQAWGGAKNEFAKGFASVTNDTEAVKAALAQPGVVLRRPFSSKEPFAAQAALPKVKAAPKSKKKQRKRQHVKRDTEAAQRGKQKAARAAAKQELDAKLRAIKDEEERLNTAREAARAEYKSRLKRRSRR